MSWQGSCNEIGHLISNDDTGFDVAWICSICPKLFFFFKEKRRDNKYILTVKFFVASCGGLG